MTLTEKAVLSQPARGAARLPDPLVAPLVPRVVYLAMKPQLRGRIRRNVVTLLELGADVTVLTVRSNKDFFVGLEHPRLRAEFMEARSLYVRVSQYTSERSRQQAERRRARAAARSEQPLQVRRILLFPLYLVGAVLLLPLRLLVRVAGDLPVVAAAVEAVRDLPARMWRRLPLAFRQRAWVVARWRIRSGRRFRRSWRRNVRPVLLRAAAAGPGLLRRLVGGVRGPDTAAASARFVVRGGRWVPVGRTWGRRRVLARRAIIRRRRIVSRWLLNRRLTFSRASVRRTKDLLRPWHRTSRFFAFWKESSARAAQLSPDLVVSSDLPGLVGAGRVARRLGVPHLHDCHELYLESTSFRSTERRLLAPMERHHLRRADSVVAVNESIAVEYGRRYGRRPVVVRNCASRLTGDLEVHDLRLVVGLPETARIVLYQGGFAVGRGLEVCVAAVPDLPPDVHLVLLGFGPLRDDLLAMAAAQGVTDRVHVLDAVSPEELASSTISATVGLMPYQPVSRNNFYALPNKIFEYTAVGLPVVVSDAPELRRIAIDAGCGDVYDSFDPRSLAAALRRVLDPLAYPRHRAAAEAYGRVNVWENEREILIGELLRVSPALREAEGDADQRALAG